MPRFDPAGQVDDPVRSTVDTGFVGVEQRLPPRLIPDGYLEKAQNKDFRFGVAQTRRGGATVKWAEQAGVNFPIDFPFNFDLRIGFGTIFGATVFSDPNGVEGILLAVEQGVWKLIPNGVPVLIRLPGCQQIDKPVRMEQAFDKVLMFRASEPAVAADTTLEWNPLLDFTAGVQRFKEIVQTSARGTDADNTFGDGTDTVPNAEDGIVMANRLCIISGRDSIIVSDILDFSRYNAITQNLRINFGSDDTITRLYQGNQNALLVFKDQSINFISNFGGDLSLIRADVLTTEFGCIARDAVTTVGNDIWFLSENGIFTVRQALDNLLQADVQPITAPIEKLMSRINWDFAFKAVTAYDENKFYLGVPIDGVQYNNAIFVFDFLNNAWAGIWTAEWLDVKRFLRTTRAGKRRLFVVNDNNLDNVAYRGAVIMLNSDLEDNIYGEILGIKDSLTSRGYSWGVLDEKRMIKIAIDQSTWKPKFSHSYQMDGVNELFTLETDVTKSRTKYYTHGKAKYDVTNVNDDHCDPWREDYSIVPASSTVGPDPKTKGVDPQKMQRIQETAVVHTRGQYIQVIQENSEGVCNVHGINVEATAGQKGYREKV